MARNSICLTSNVLRRKNWYGELRGGTLYLDGSVGLGDNFNVLNLISESKSPVQSAAKPTIQHSTEAKSTVPGLSKPSLPATLSPEKTGRGSVSWVVYLLAVLGILIGAAGTYLAWETKKQSEQQIQAAGEKIKSTEKDLGEFRAALEKKIQEDTGKLRIQLEAAAGQVQKLEEQGKVVSRELEVISTLKTQQQSFETRLDRSDKSSRETSRKLEVTQAGLEDLKKNALKASISPQDPSARNAPVGMKFYLTRESLAAIAQANGISSDPAQLKEKWKNLFFYPFGNPEGQKIENAVSRSAVATGVVGSDGAVELQQVTPGEYYVLGATGQAGGFVYEKKIKVDQSTQDVLLNR